MTSSTKTHLLAIALLLAAPGCEVDRSPIDGDSGVPGTDAGRDAGTVPADDVRPRIIDSAPDDGSTEIARTTPVVVTFSEPMRAIGTWSARVGGVAVEGADAALDDDTLTLTPGSTWPAASEIEIRLANDWTDRAGNTLERPFVLRFVTADDAGPVVVSSSPAEGATNVSTHTTALRVRFDEPMDPGAGTVRLEGGAGTIAGDAPSWSSTEVTYALAGLEHDATYRIVLEGFRDLEGNVFDGTSGLGDGAIDFTTGPDVEAPRAITSTPREGQVDVSPVDLGGVVEVTFDEDMDTSTESVSLVVGSDAPISAPVTWPDARRARISVAGRLRLDAEIAIDLRALRDVEGNALAPEPYLADGRLQFTTGIDAFVPVVVASTPEEGATGVPSPLAQVRLAFSEAMDESIAEVEIRDNRGGVFAAEGTWLGGGTTLDVPFDFRAGRSYAIDVTGLRDRSGTPVSDAHAYLGDGALDIALAVPSGASCAEPLQVEHGTTDPATGRTTFVLRGAARVRDNGSQSCDAGGHGGQDAVVQYTKTTPSLGDASGSGRALRITATTGTNNVDLEVFRDLCDPRDPAAAAALVRCASDHDVWDVVLDVGAGEYFIWVANTASRGDITVTVEEVTALREGEQCESAYDSTSAIYTPPTAPGAPHVWTVPASAGASVDVDVSNGPTDGLSCVETERDDVVLSFTKADDDTVLDVTIVSSGFRIASELVFGGCRPGDAGATRDACTASIDSATGARFTARGPAGPVHLWLSSSLGTRPFEGARVEVREIPAPVAPGSSCATAIELEPGASVAVLPDHAGRYDAPRCFAPSADVTWYAFEMTEELAHLTADVAGGLALVDAATGAQLGCSTDATARPLFRFAPVGTRVCVAVETGSLVRSLGITPIEYDGAGPTAPERLAITRPSLAGTILTTFDSESWMAVTPTRLYQNVGLLAAMRTELATGASVLHPELDTRSTGRSALSIGEQVFAVAQQMSNTTRVFRYADASGAWAPEVWDLGTPSGTYPGTIDALTTDGTWLYVVENATSTSTTVRHARVLRLPASAPGPATLVGSIDRGYGISAAAIDGQYLYFLGRASGTRQDGVYRVALADLSAEGAPAVPTRIYAFVTDAGGETSFGNMALDDTASPRYLYFSGANGTIHVLDQPASPAPRYLGIIWYGENGDRAWALQPDTGAVFAFSTSRELAGAWYRLDP